jgi:predicted pyridoxine 5'-phosphate oxidase superfamily flavin-nucleotide-binding protein
MSSSSSDISTQQQFFMVSFLFVSIAAVAFAAAAASSSLELLTLREFGLMLIGAVLSSIVTVIITTLSSSSSSSSSKHNYNNINDSSTAAAAAAVPATTGCNKVTPSEDDVKQKQQQQDKNCGGGGDDDEKQENENDINIIRSVKELREIMPAGGNGSNLNDSKKVIGYLDDQMIQFISKSPLLQLATVDSKTGKPSVSPKGDQPGFVTVVVAKKDDDDDDGIMKGISLIIPDRPGNRMMLGLQNILNGNKNVSIMFEIPGMCTTLRCGGINARISKDTTLLKNHAARNCTPKVVILIDIEYAFFHCAKAYMRSGIWDPTTWPSSSSSSSSSSSRQSGGDGEGEDECKEFKVGLGRYYAPKDSFLANVIDNDISDHYKGVQDAINGEGREVER